MNRSIHLDVSSLLDAVAGYVGGIWVPFKKVDVCKTLTPQCPLTPGTTATFSFSIAISKAYPTVSDVYTIH